MNAGHAKKTICFDIDGCICSATASDYDNAIPNQDAIDVINELFDKGHHILIHTSRFMGRTNSNAKEAHALGYEFTKGQLEEWGVKYHELLFGKPRADIVIDDHGIFFTDNWKKIRKDLEKRL